MYLASFIANSSTPAHPSSFVSTVRVLRKRSPLDRMFYYTPKREARQVGSPSRPGNEMRTEDPGQGLTAASLESVAAGLKTCKICLQAMPPTIEYFERCQRYKDGLQSRCKTCLKEIRTRARERRHQESQVEPVKFYTVSADGYLRCTACTGQIYDSGLNGELYCLMCARWVNPPRTARRRCVGRQHAIIGSTYRRRRCRVVPWPSGSSTTRPRRVTDAGRKLTLETDDATA